MGKKYVIEVEDEPFEYQGTKYWPAAHIPRVFFDAEDLAEMDIYEESTAHNFEVGDVCYLPEEFNNQKLIVTKIAPHMIGYMRSDGSTYAMLETRFKSGAVFAYHSKSFEDFLKGDFT